ncbi:MAG: DEAD/DEAH box helicase domain protein [Parcubacteria group bacterium GW2011_GWB1_44_7]|nr:MAG: DEAD/DEAH box helicase domain protein [Parcubacteria group bacterium GW2011_GWB1_44_7]
MRKVVFDIETTNYFSDIGKNDPASLDLAVVCLYDSADDSYKSFTQKELPGLWPILEKADLLIGFNSEHFDIPLLNKYYSGDLSKIRGVDLLKEVKKVLGRRIKLDILAEATLGRKKTGDGTESVRWWRAGEIKKVIDYCIEDVRITKELYEYALNNHHLKYRDRKILKEIPLDTNHWEKITEGAETKLTHTLPF